MITAYPNSPKPISIYKVYRCILEFTHNFNSNSGHCCIIAIHQWIKLVDYLKQLVILVLNFIYTLMVLYMKLWFEPVTHAITINIVHLPYNFIAFRLYKILKPIAISPIASVAITFTWHKVHTSTITFAALKFIFVRCPK